MVRLDGALLYLCAIISAYELDNTLLKELEENHYISIYIDKPIQLTKLVDLVADTIC